MTFHCECCDFTTDKKHHYERHLTSKKHKENAFNSFDIMEVVRSMKNDIALLQQENKHLKDRVFHLEAKPTMSNSDSSHNDSHNTHTNNSHNTTYNISINIDRKTFENENLEALDGQVKRLIKNKDGAIADIVRQLHFNEKHPENRNIKAESIKSGMIGIHEATTTGKEWVRKPKKQALEDIAINATQQFKDKAEEQELSIVMEDTLKRMTDPIIDDQHCDHKKKLKSECKNIEALLQTERKAGRDPKN